MRYYFLFGIAVLLFIAGCREDIVDPLNAGANVNEPVLSTSSNIYSFSINAQNITQNILNSSQLKTFHNQLYIILNEYSSGSVSLKLINKD